MLAHAACSLALLAAAAAWGAAPAPAPKETPPAPGVGAWLEGDALGAAAELAGRDDRQSVLNRGVALLYAGLAPQAEEELARLAGRARGFTPALRWLARARAASGHPDADATLAALLASRDADSRDFLWAGRRQREAGRADAAASSFGRAVALDPDLYLGWLWLGDAEEEGGRPERARTAWLRARGLHAGGEVLLRLGRGSLRAGRVDEGRALLGQALGTPEGSALAAEIEALAPGLAAPAPRVPLALPLAPGEVLVYEARYLFFRFATVELRTEGPLDVRGRRAVRVVSTVRSKPGFPLLTIDSRFESLIAEDGSVLAHRSSSRDSTEARREAAYEMDPAAGECVVREAVAGTFGFDRFPLSRLDQDGLSILQLARALAAAPVRLSVLTAVDSTWKGTEIVSGGAERIRWAGREVEAVRVDTLGHYRGPAGLTGRMRTWISRDARAIPYRSKIRLGLGSVVLDLRDDTRRADRGERPDDGL
jgi:tetratricopeptide (TPR) repeat protein